MKLYRIFLTLSRKKQIFLIAWLFHFALLLSLMAHHFFHRSSKPHRPIAVRTQEIAAIEPTLAKPVKKPPPETRAPPQAKKIPSQRPEKPAPKDTAIGKKAAAAEIARALAEIKGSPKTAKPDLFIPSGVQIQNSSEKTKASISYSEHLISYLQNSLDLPEYGAVKIELRINRKGDLLESKILFSENQKNSEFLKNRLPELAFPCFNDFNIVENSLTFTISFRNAEIH